MRSSKAILLFTCALAYLSTGCATTNIREQSSHHAVISPANVPGLTINNDCAARGKAFIVSGGYVTDSLMFGEDPYFITFKEKWLSNVQQVILKVRLYNSAGGFVDSFTEPFSVNTQSSWEIRRADQDGYYSSYGRSRYGDRRQCWSDIVEVEPSNQYRILGGLITGTIERGRGTGSRRGGSGRPEWSTTGLPEWEE